MSTTTRDQRIKATKKDAKHLLEELWDVEPDKIFTREPEKGIEKSLLYSNTELKELSCR